ncbi:unnamed protein product (macronuclear) [Paramecium tetraurelia]|uniref:Transmembrane protein n=1 Tax=Paramecium tetraurelia TaxID=5888 RepID=A0DX06_PARTE|nr:uncharacterized protein GSPATT00021205001 [Paramecium tetraurelia]CAK87573.1 unnamed protein product [Paramecium tetraurelia]|eukprot:XP_001454970.1 hypothetical protein (macronuclear) [Paramecium tetraurelia strain d4-2]
MNKSINLPLDQNLQTSFGEFIYQGSKQYQRLIFLLMFIYSITRFLSTLFGDKNYYFIGGGGFVIQTILSIAISIKGKLFIKKIAIQITCVIFCFMQIQVYETKNFQEIYDNSQLLMIFNIIVYGFIGFNMVLIQVIAGLGIRIWISIVKDGFNIYSLIYQLIGDFAILLYCYYNHQILKKGFRQQCFDNQLCTKIDYTIVRFLPFLIQNQFLLINFDEKAQQFNLRFGNKITSIIWDDSNAPTKNLRIFLRRYYFEQISLEQFILSRISKFKEKFDYFFTKSFNVTGLDLNDHLNINYTECFLGEKYYLITFNGQHLEQQQFQTIQEQFMECLNSNQSITVSFLKKQLFQLSNLKFNQNIQQQISKLKLHCMYFLGQFKQVNSFAEVDFHLKDINMSKLMKQITYLFCNAYNTQNFELVSLDFQDIYIKSNEELIQTFILIIYQMIIRLKSIDLKNIIQFGVDYRDNQLIFIQIQTECYSQLKFELEQNPLFKKIQRRLCPNLEIHIINNSKQSPNIQALKLFLYQNQEALEQIRKIQEEII